MNEEQRMMRIREIILNMDKPFCIINLLIKTSNEGLTDRKEVLSVLDELYDEGVVVFENVEHLLGNIDGPKYAFRVA